MGGGDIISDALTLTHMCLARVAPNRAEVGTISNIISTNPTHP
jgi:hypothetical protein